MNIYHYTYKFNNKASKFTEFPKIGTEFKFYTIRYQEEFISSILPLT